MAIESSTWVVIHTASTGLRYVVYKFDSYDHARRWVNKSHDRFVGSGIVGTGTFEIVPSYNLGEPMPDDAVEGDHVSA
jgi:hypothetical protein